MPKSKFGSPLRWLWLSLMIVVIDQITKIWAETVLVHGSITLFPWFDLALAYNTGAAFSFLADAGGWQRYFFLGIGLVAVVVIIVWLQRLQSHERLLACGLALILGGAIGNIIDRTLYGHVIDFIVWHYKSWYWPAFNIADSAISLGAVLVIWSSFKAVKPETEDNQ